MEGVSPAINRIYFDLGTCFLRVRKVDILNFHRPKYKELWYGGGGLVTPHACFRFPAPVVLMCILGICLLLLFFVFFPHVLVMCFLPFLLSPVQNSQSGPYVLACLSAFLS